MITDTLIKCWVCNGKIMEFSGSEYRGDPMHLIIGPGSRNQMSPVHAWWCEKCGISYHHLPTEEKPG